MTYNPSDTLWDFMDSISNQCICFTSLKNGLVQTISNYVNYRGELSFILAQIPIIIFRNKSFCFRMLRKYSGGSLYGAKRSNQPYPFPYIGGTFQDLQECVKHLSSMKETITWILPLSYTHGQRNWNTMRLNWSKE